MGTHHQISGKSIWEARGKNLPAAFLRLTPFKFLQRKSSPSVWSASQWGGGRARIPASGLMGQGQGTEEQGWGPVDLLTHRVLQEAGVRTARPLGHSEVGVPHNLDCNKSAPARVVSVPLTACVPLPAPQPPSGSRHADPRSARSCFVCFPLMGDILIFFRALSQDDQDDIHLKLEDIIQLVSSPTVSSSTIASRLALRGQQCARPDHGALGRAFCR